MLKYRIILFCFLAYLISWGSKFFIIAHDAGRINHVIPIGALQLLAQFGPTIAGVTMIFATGREKGILALLKNLSRFHIHCKWYIFCIFFELILFLVIVLTADFNGRFIFLF